jgi:hypothetical protein
LPPRRIAPRYLGGAAALYAALACVATWPLLLHFRDRVPGQQRWGSLEIMPESLLNLWNLWWFRYALLELGQDPFDCRYVFYPYGADLWFHALAPLHALLAIPLQAFASLAATQNLMLLFDFVAAGVLSFALGVELGLSRGGALLAGAVYAFAPPVFAHLYAGHYELIAIYWLPAMLLAWLRLVGEASPRPSRGIGLGLLFALTAYSSPYYLVYGAELLAVAALVDARRTLRPGVLRALAVTVAVAAVGLAPLLGKFLDPDAPGTGASVSSEFDRHSGDLIGFFVPSFTHPLLAEPLLALHQRMNPKDHLPQETTTYAGVSVLALASLGVLARRRAREPLALLLAIVLVFSVLSLGSHLRILGEPTGVPLPTRLLEEVPLLRIARAPGRHMVVAMLGLALLAGAGWQRLPAAWLRWPALALLALDLAAMPVPTLSTEVGPVDRHLASLPGGFAVLDVPLGARDGQRFGGWPDNRRVFAQTVHRHPVVSGAVSRLSPETWEALFAAPVIGTLLEPKGAGAEAIARDRAQGAAFLARFRIDAVIVHPGPDSGIWRRYLESVLPIRGRERFADGTELWWLRGP